MSTDLVRLVRLGLGLYVRKPTGLNYAAFCAELGALCWQPRGLLGELRAVCWQPTGPKSPVGPSLGQQPTSLMGPVGPSLEVYVGNLHVFWILLGPVWTELEGMAATYRFHRACWTELGGCMPAYSACWKPPASLVGLLDRAWGCMLATTEFGAVCRQHTGLMESLGLLGGNLHVLSCWTEFEAICWQPTGLLGPVGLSLGCWQPTVRNLGACWTELGAVHWETYGFLWFGAVSSCASCWHRRYVDAELQSLISILPSFVWQYWGAAFRGSLLSIKPRSQTEKQKSNETQEEGY